MKFTEKSWSLFIFILIGILIGIFIRLFLIDVVRIDGNSMDPLLKDGQKVFVSRISYGIVKPFSSCFIFQWKTPEIDDTVVFQKNDKMLVKRCIATEKTVLEYIDDSGYYLKVDEKLYPLSTEQYNRLKGYSSVPENMIFVIGLNFSESYDSRDFGFVSAENVIGKVLCK